MAQRVNAAVSALNEMSGAGERASGTTPTTAQARALEHLRDTIAAVAPDGDVLRARGAFCALRGPGGSAYGLPTNLASYQKDLLSLPQSSTRPVPLTSLLPEGDPCVVTNFEQSCVRTDADLEKMNAEFGVMTPYSIRF